MNIEQKLSALQTGETLLVQALKTKNPNKVQLEFAEKVRDTTGNAGSLLGMLNKSDDRFSSGARRAWLTAEINDVSELLNINVGDDADWGLTPTGKDALPIGILNPMIHGMRARLQINETVVPTEYQADNIDTAAKRKGASGDFITFKGQHIFSNTDVVLMKGDDAPEHTVLKADSVSIKAATPVTDEVGL
jgi:hypothetical protein|tara:strand:- start:12402 stop:12974 length:573 start_codon:yes stop_codon:yes gene_type:complete